MAMGTNETELKENQTWCTLKLHRASSLRKQKGANLAIVPLMLIKARQATEGSA